MACSGWRSGRSHTWRCTELIDETCSDERRLCLLCRSVAEKMKLPILARFRSFAAVGVDPAVMGIGRFVFKPIRPYMADVVPLSKNQAGLIAASNFLGHLIGSLPAGTS